ncbi:hypothetical protein FO488_15925 [Geobacter sp. FeAm09]|uniref:hypothetical protein n=1 Tax=Geobacter sp. FeAm09 TaxID=2597769 RepID=UPI0011EFBBBD|nr:hypothetical protein [Geobacter sp. FeAm09]QEM69496.1 hypothetical protein FO488_15925 [Geobacter sp. FeAm09]
MENITTRIIDGPNCTEFEGYNDYIGVCYGDTITFKREGGTYEAEVTNVDARNTVSPKTGVKYFVEITVTGTRRISPPSIWSRILHL